jgi:hypothetical protein
VPLSSIRYDIPRIPPYKNISNVSPSSGANSLGALGSNKQTLADVEPSFSTRVKIGSVWRCALEEEDGVVVSRYFWRGGMEDCEREVKWSCDDGPIRLSICAYLPISLLS